MLMSPWINYHHLFYFKTIADEGSVSRAAEKLRIGQPTLSAQLKQFEDTIGIQLFDRHHKKLVLTEQGKIALDYAKNIFRMGSEMYEVLHDRVKPSKLSVHIAAIDDIPKNVILMIMQAALKIAPCQITLAEGKADDLIRQLHTHKIDLIITNFLPVGIDAKGLYPKLISKENLSFYASDKFKTLRKGFPKSISAQPLALPTYDSKIRYDLDHWAKLNQIELNIIAESQDIGVKKLIAEQGLGLIPTTRLTVEENGSTANLIRIGSLKGIYEEIFLITAGRKIPNPVAEELMNSFSLMK